jgi:hypothetical protein
MGTIEFLRYTIDTYSIASVFGGWDAVGQSGSAMLLSG